MIKGEDKELNKKKRKRKRKNKERQSVEEHLSFSEIDYMMRKNPGIDERRCR